MSKASSIALYLFVWLVCTTQSSSGITYYVAASGSGEPPYTNWATASPTIAHVMGLATDGDQVLVTNGVYALDETIVITSAIHMIGVNAAANTVIDGMGSNRCFYLAHEQARVEGFTITRGYALLGSGVYITNGGHVLNCVITGNDTMAASSSATGGIGGGVYLTGSGLVSDSVIASNSSFFSGAGVVIRQGGVVSNCVIQGNHSPFRGAGCFVDRGGTIVDSRICANVSDSGEGGIASYAGVTIERCIVTDNIGDGLYLDYSNAQVRNSVIARNTGRGVYAFGATTIENCTVTANGGRGMYLYFVTGGIVANCIVYPESIDQFCHATYCATILNCWSGQDPRFRNPQTGDYRLLPDSPCRDMGTNLSWMVDATDLGGRPRVVNDIVDIGPYEFCEAPDSIDVSDDSVLCKWSVVTGETYRFEASSSLTAGNWTAIGSTITAAVHSISHSDTSGLPGRFYRLIFRPSE